MPEQSRKLRTLGHRTAQQLPALQAGTSTAAPSSASLGCTQGSVAFLRMGREPWPDLTLLQRLALVVFHTDGLSQRPGRSPQLSSKLLLVLGRASFSFGHILSLIQVLEMPRGHESQRLVTPSLRKHCASSVSNSLLLIFPFWFLLQGKSCQSCCFPLSRPFAL